MTTDTKTDTLARLRELAQRAQMANILTQWVPIAAWTEDDHEARFITACDPQTIIRMCDVIAAADAMRNQGYQTYSTFPEAVAYDAARAALDKP